MNSDARFTVIRTLLGVVLIVASALKLYQVFFGSVMAYEVFFESELVLSFTILWEMFFGVWLIVLGGVFPRFTWLVATAFFSTLTGVAVVHIWRGESCPCFGGQDPSIALSVDVAAILCLYVSRPATLFSRNLHNTRSLAWIAACAIVGAGIPAAFFLTQPGREWLYGIAGFPIVPDRFSRDVSLPRDGGMGEAQFVIRNLSDAPVMLLGVEATCGCIALSGIPVTIQPGQVEAITFKVVSGPISNRISRSERAKLYLNTPSPPIVLTFVIHEGV